MDSKRAARVSSVVITTFPDPDPDPDQENCIAIRAEATIVVPLAPDVGLLQTITSSGLYGIDAPINDPYRAEVAREQFDELCVVLRTLGVENIPPFEHATHRAGE